MDRVRLFLKVPVGRCHHSAPEDHMRGDKIQIRLYNGELVLRVIWDEMETCVVVTSESNYEKLLRGEWEALPIGFPLKDVKL